MTAIKRPDHDPKVERYYPDVVAPAKEFKKLASAENPEFQILWDQAWEWMKNTFVYDFSEAGCERWEKMLDIAPEPGDSFEDRRRAILARIQDSRPYTERTLSKYVENILGPNDDASVKVVPNDYVVKVSARSAISPKIPKALVQIRSYIPANLTLKGEIDYKHERTLYVGMKRKTSRVINVYPMDSQKEVFDKPLYLGIAMEVVEDLEIR